jgi:hypothetical protein
VKQESIKEFLARGGKVNKIPEGESIYKNPSRRGRLYPKSYYVTGRIKSFGAVDWGTIMGKQ